MADVIAIPYWLACIAMILMVFMPVAGMFVGAWLAFRIKVAGTGFSLLQPDDVNKGEAPYSYASKIFDDAGEPLVGLDPELSEAAKRIRDQRLSNPGLANVMSEVEGVVS